MHMHMKNKYVTQVFIFFCRQNSRYMNQHICKCSCTNAVEIGREKIKLLNIFAIFATPGNFCSNSDLVVVNSLKVFATQINQKLLLHCRPHFQFVASAEFPI